MTVITQGRLSFLHPSRKPSRIAGAAIGAGRYVRRTVRLWRRRLQDRAALGRLTHRDMRDIGATPADIAWEMSQPFWREPRRR